MTSPSWLSTLVRWRWLLLGGLTAAMAFFAHSDDPPDLASFAQRGSSLLSGHLAQVYAGSWNQAGPLQLIGARLLLVGAAGGRPTLVVELLVDLALIALLRTVCGRAQVPVLGQVVVAAFAITWLGPSGLWSGHPVEVAIPILWLVAASQAARGGWARCGVLLGAAVLIAPWAILAAPIAFIGRTRAISAITVAVGVTVLGYLPFALSGHFELFGNTWLVNSRTLVHLVAPDVTHFGWGLRVLQAAIVAGGCWAVVRWRRDQRDARWAALLIVVLLRILLDPVILGYYWLPAAVLVIAGATTVAGRTRRQLAALMLLAYLTYLGGAGVAPILVALAAVGATVGVVIGPVRRLDVHDRQQLVRLRHRGEVTE